MLVVRPPAFPSVASPNAVIPPTRCSPQPAILERDRDRPPGRVSRLRKFGPAAGGAESDLRPRRRHPRLAVRPHQRARAQHRYPGLVVSMIVSMVASTAVAPDELWHVYGTKVRSTYSLFAKVNGKKCKCLWCGDVQ